MILPPLIVVNLLSGLTFSDSEHLGTTVGTRALSGK